MRFKRNGNGMMALGSGLFCVTALLFSCGDKQKLADVLSREKMVEVIIQLYVEEDKVERLGLQPDSSRQVFEVIKEKMATRTGIPDSVFRRSLEYYAKRPEDMERIYDAVVDSLNLLEQRASFGKEE